MLVQEKISTRGEGEPVQTKHRAQVGDTFSTGVCLGHVVKVDVIAAKQEVIFHSYYNC
jgi:hypothetical protein